jgi:hypothetical protein
MRYVAVFVFTLLIFAVLAAAQELEERLQDAEDLLPDVGEYEKAGSLLEELDTMYLAIKSDIAGELVRLRLRKIRGERA